MEHVRGKDLGVAWRHLSQDQKKRTITEIAGYISQLRNLEPPHEGIVASASIDGAHDHRAGSSPFGPFATHKGFHSYLRVNVPNEDCTKGFGAEVTECHTLCYQSCFTHADLVPRDIIVDNGKVSSIIDWQFGGWYPEY